MCFYLLKRTIHIAFLIIYAQYVLTMGEVKNYTGIHDIMRLFLLTPHMLDYYRIGGRDATLT